MHESKKEKKEMVPHYFDSHCQIPTRKKKDGSFPFQNKRGKENSL